MIEGYVHETSVFRFDPTEIGTFGQGWGGVLDLVNEDKARRVIGREFLSNFLAQGYRVTAEKVFFGFKIDFNDVIRVCSGVEQMLLEEFEEQKAFPATPNASKNLDHVVILGLNQSVQKQIAFDDHFAFLIVNTLSGLKVLYQKHHGFVGCAFRKVDILMMLKADDVGASTLGKLEKRQALMHRRSFASEGTFGNAEPEGCASMCAQPIRVIRIPTEWKFSRREMNRELKEVA